MSSARYCKLDPATRTIQPDEHSPSEDTILDGPNQAVPPGPQDVDKATRVTALMDLTRQLHPRIVSDLLGITASSAAAWARLSGGEWSDYPALRSTST